MLFWVSHHIKLCGTLVFANMIAPREVSISVRTEGGSVEALPM